MSEVLVQFGVILDQALERTDLEGQHGARWTTDPPHRIEATPPTKPPRGAAQLVNESVVDVAYQTEDGSVTFYLAINQDSHGQVQARATASREGFSAAAHLTGKAPNWEVAVTFKKSR